MAEQIDESTNSAVSENAESTTNQNSSEKRILSVVRVNRLQSDSIKSAIIRTLNVPLLASNNDNDDESSSSNDLPISILEESIETEIREELEDKIMSVPSQVNSANTATCTPSSSKEAEHLESEADMTIETSSTIPSFYKLHTYLQDKRLNDSIAHEKIITEEKVEKNLSAIIETSVQVRNVVTESNHSPKPDIKPKVLSQKDSNMGKNIPDTKPSTPSDLNEYNAGPSTSKSYSSKYDNDLSSQNEPDNAVDLLLRTFGDGNKLNAASFGKQEYLLEDELEYEMLNLHNSENEQSDDETVDTDYNDLQSNIGNMMGKSPTEIINPIKANKNLNAGPIVIESKVLAETEKIDIESLQDKIRVNKKLPSAVKKLQAGAFVSIDSEKISYITAAPVSNEFKQSCNDLNTKEESKTISPDSTVQIKSGKSNSTKAPNLIVGETTAENAGCSNVSSQEDRKNAETKCKKGHKSYRKGKINLVERKRPNATNSLNAITGPENSNLDKPQASKTVGLNLNQSLAENITKITNTKTDIPEPEISTPQAVSSFNSHEKIERENKKSIQSSKAPEIVFIPVKPISVQKIELPINKDPTEDSDNIPVYTDLCDQDNNNHKEKSLIGLDLDKSTAQKETIEKGLNHMVCNADISETKISSMKPLKTSLKRKTDESDESNNLNSQKIPSSRVRKVSFDLTEIQKLKEENKNLSNNQRAFDTNNCYGGKRFRTSFPLKSQKKDCDNKDQESGFTFSLKKFKNKESSAEVIKLTSPKISADSKNDDSDKTATHLMENAEISPHFQNNKPLNLEKRTDGVEINDITASKKGLKKEEMCSDESDFNGFEDAEMSNLSFNAKRRIQLMKIKRCFKASSIKSNPHVNIAQNKTAKILSNKLSKFDSKKMLPDTDEDIKVPLKKRKIQQIASFDNSKEDLIEFKSPDINSPCDQSGTNNIGYVKADMINSPALVKRGRKPKNETVTTNSYNVTSEILDSYGPKKRGRKLKDKIPDSSPDKSVESLNTNNYDPTMLLIQGKERTFVPYDDKNHIPLPGEVQCGFCKEYTFKKNWINHLALHYGIGWIQGDPEVNVQSYNVVLSTMIKFQKNNKIPGLACRLCGNIYKSALGILRHIQTCQLPDKDKKERLRVSCEYCKKEYSVFTITSHIKTCQSLLMSNPNVSGQSEQLNTEPITPETQKYSNTGRVKRRSVIKAEEIIKHAKNSFEIDPNEFILTENSDDGRGLFMIWKKEIRLDGYAKCPKTKCNFTGNSYEIMKEHTKSCNAISQRSFVCKICKYKNIDSEIVKSHIIETHKTFDTNNDENCSDTEMKSDLGSEDYSLVDENDLTIDKTFEDLDDDELDKSVKRKFKKQIQTESSFSGKVTGDNKKVYKEKRHTNIIGHTMKLSQFFCDSNLTSKILFSTFIPLPAKMHFPQEYLPKYARSMKFAYKSDKNINKQSGDSKPANDWISLDRFESKSMNDELVLFIGGPIKCVAWVPICCKETTSQYFAVAYRHSLNTFSRAIETNPKKTSVLIFECNRNLSAKMLYGITIDLGPVHYLEFMPSGGYAPEINRLGLLAVGSAEADINIYSLPIHKSSNNPISFIELKPAFTLTFDVRKNWPNTENYCNFQTNRIAWSEAKGHNHIVAGFSNGSVAIWDITNESDNLNRIVQADDIKYVPVCFFRDCEKGIIDIKLHYNQKLRWMVVVAMSREIVVYDLKNLNRPVMISQDIGKNALTCADWPIIWENYNVGLGEALATYGCVLTTMSPSSLVFKNRRSAKTVSSVTSAHFNCWFNISAVGSENGDTFIEFMRELNLDIAKVTTTCDKYLAYVDIVGLNEDIEHVVYSEKNKVSPDWKIFHPDYMKKYGLVFGPSTKYTKEKIALITDKKRDPGINLAQFVQVNWIRFNLNQNVKDILAIGYENGIIRILKISKNT